MAVSVSNCKHIPLFVWSGVIKHLRPYYHLDDPISDYLGVEPLLKKFLYDSTVTWEEYETLKESSPAPFPFNDVTQIDNLPVSIDDDLLEQIIEDFPSLETVTLSGCYQITDEGIKLLQRLKIKKLALCILNITDTAMRHLKGIESLSILTISNCQYLSPKGIEEIFSLETLEQVHFINVKLNKSQLDWFKQYKLQSPPKKTRHGGYTFTCTQLDLDTADDLIISRTIDTECLYNRVATNLTLNRCQLTNEGFSSIAQGKFKTLSLFASTIPHQARFPTEFCRELESLTITDSEEANNTFSAFIEASKLKILKIMNCQYTDVRILSCLFMSSPFLEQLDLRSISITDELLSLIGRMENLSQLTLINCFGFSLSSLANLKNPKLRILRISTKESSKDALFGAIQGLCLEELHIKGITLDVHDVLKHEHFLNTLTTLQAKSTLWETMNLYLPKVKFIAPSSQQTT